LATEIFEAETLYAADKGQKIHLIGAIPMCFH